MDETQMKKRTQAFAKGIIRLCRELPNDRESQLIGNQIFRSGTSVASTYRSVCRARSEAEFISRLSIVEEDADETLFWVELIQEMRIFNAGSLNPLMKECNEIIAIVASTIKAVKMRKLKAIQNPNSKL